MLFRMRVHWFQRRLLGWGRSTPARWRYIDVYGQFRGRLIRRNVRIYYEAPRNA